MSRMSTKKKSVPAVILGVLVAAVAGYFGVDAVTGDNGDTTASSTTTTTSPAASGSSATTTSSAAAAAAAAASSVGGEDDCAVDTLPEQADDVIDAILDGGPFDNPDDDGKHFGNYEGVLPSENSSYYREYTVETPGLSHRGARRIVVGGGSDTDPDVWYYTDDHYETFCYIPDAED